jgi:predicted DNA-binding transcriptional regulator AlpA
MIAYDQKRAAKAMCMSEKQFSELVEEGVLPKPKMLGRYPRWDAALLQKIVSGDLADGMEGVKW